MNTHFPSLDFDLGEDIEMLRESVYQFARLEIAPMAEAAAGAAHDPERVKAMAAATDNIGLFFGEDIFIAIGCGSRW